MAQRFVVVMAGGSGTRFWPASRAERPKQFLQIGDSGETLLQATVRRAAALVGKDQVFVVTNARHGEPTREQLPDLPADNVMLEPAARNTAPCIAWAAGRIRRRSADAVIGVLPADPHIGDEKAFAAVLDRALSAAEGGSVVTIGIEPNRPETGYGYVDVGDPAGDGVNHVRAFVEKPTREKAVAFLEAGHYLWNSGMFFFRADTILREVERHLPELGEFVTKCDDAAARGQEAPFVQDAYAGLPKVSIDYGVMEKADDILVVPGSFGWDDIGSWSAAWELARKDGDGNAHGGGEQLSVDSRGCYTTTREGKLVALIGVEDLIVVDTGDALLVVPRDRAQDVREVVDALREGERGEFL
jgi:mannose-1-phosphate guanylyltransferase